MKLMTEFEFCHYAILRFCYDYICLSLWRGRAFCGMCVIGPWPTSNKEQQQQPDSQQRGPTAPRRWGIPRSSASSCLAETPEPQRTQRQCPLQRSPWQPAPPHCRHTGQTGIPRSQGWWPDWQQRLRTPIKRVDIAMWYITIWSSWRL